MSRKLREFLECIIITDDIMSTEDSDEFWRRLASRKADFSDGIRIKALATFNHIC